MNKIRIIILILLTKNTFAQNFDWAFGGGQWSDDDITGAITDNNGNIYITGFNSFSGAHIGTYVLDSWGVYIAKFDSSGNLIWVIESDESFDTYSTGIAIDYNENLYITGYYTHSTSFGNFFLQGALESRMFIVKISSTGNIIWAKDFGTLNDSNGTYVHGITIDRQNNIYLTGSFKGTIRFCDFDLNSKIGSYFPNYDIFIAKLNNDGDCMWARRAGGINEDFAHDIAVDCDNNIYITGIFSPYNADFGNIEPTLSNTSLCEFTAKYNSNGDAVWVKAADQMNNTISEATSIAVDGNNFIYSMGNLYGTIVISGDTLSSVGGGRTNYIVKYNSNGDIIETKNLNNTIWVNIYWLGAYKRKIGDIAIGSDNSLFVTSSYSGNIENSDFNLYNSANSDIFVAKYNDIGYFQWVKNISGSGNETSTTIYAKNKLIVGGNYTSQQLVFDSLRITNFSGNNDEDFFIASLSDTIQIECPETFLTLNTDRDYICSDNHATMICSTTWGNSFNWYRNEVLDTNNKDSIFITDKPGNYYVIVNPFSICSDTSTSISIEKFTTPVAHILDTVINSSYYLSNETDDTSFSYIWYYNDYSNVISNQHSIMIPDMGTYILSLSNICGTSEDSITINVDEVLSIFPNPNNGHFSLMVSNLKSDSISLFIYDISGKKILEKTYYTNSNYLLKEIDVYGVESAEYFVIIKTGRNVYSKKIQILKNI